MNGGSKYNVNLWCFLHFIKNTAEGSDISERCFSASPMTKAGRMKYWLKIGWKQFGKMLVACRNVNLC